MNLADLEHWARSLPEWAVAWFCFSVLALEGWHLWWYCRRQWRWMLRELRKRP